MAEVANTMNTIEISIDELARYIGECMEDGDYDPVMVLGPAGVGKTVSLRNMARRLGIGYLDMRLIDKTELDLIGLPDTEVIKASSLRDDADDGEEIKATTYHANILLPYAKRDGDVGIFVIDEITSASRNVRAAALQLLDSSRSIGTYHLPEKWKIIAIGNGEEDGGIFDGMEGVVINRCATFRLRPEFESWKKWAISDGHINPTVVAYLSLAQDNLHCYDPNSPDAVFPSPRSWEKLSTKLNMREAKAGGQGKLSPESVHMYAAPFVGKKVAAEFQAFYNYNKYLIEPKDILEGKVKGADLQKLEKQAIYIILESVVKMLKEKFENDPNKKARVDAFDNDFAYTEPTLSAVTNVINWAVEVGENVSNEYASLIITDLTQNIPGIEDLLLLGIGLGAGGADEAAKRFASFDKWSSEHGKFS